MCGYAPLRRCDDPTRGKPTICTGASQHTTAPSWWGRRAVVSAIFWLFALPVLPIFALTAILIDSLIIYALSSPE
jgi:hypothetical protein